MKRKLHRQVAHTSCLDPLLTFPEHLAHRISQYRAVRPDRLIKGESRGGRLIIYIHATLAISAMNPTAEEITRTKILINNSYLPQSANFLQKMGFLDLEFQAELQQCKITYADLNAHDSHWDSVARPTEREVLAATMLDDAGAFLNTGASTS